jgi:hypothetical protein
MSRDGGTALIHVSAIGTQQARHRHLRVVDRQLEATSQQAPGEHNSSIGDLALMDVTI